MSVLGRVARQSVKALSAAVDVVARPPAGIVVLAYHQVGGPRPSAVNLDPAVFADQLAWLAEHAEVVDLDTAVARLTAPTARGATDEAGAAGAASTDRVTGLPIDDAGGARRPTVVLTFDDGTVDVVERALPLLADHGFPMALYLATGHVEDGTSFWDDGTVLGWDHLRDAVATGLVTIGSHTHGHVLLDRLPAADVEAELDRSVDLVGDRLGVACEHFAYPKALPPSPAADRAVRARFRSAALAGGRVNVPGATDVWRLARTPIQTGDAGWFARKASGGLRLEGELRERLAARRTAGATT